MNRLYEDTYIYLLALHIHRCLSFRYLFSLSFVLSHLQDGDAPEHPQPPPFLLPTLPRVDFQ